jgi:hypothetical protein
MEQINQLKEYIRTIIKGYTDSLLVIGKQGIGKTYVTLKTLSDEKSVYRIITSSISPLSLYKILYANNDCRKILVFDDIDGLFEDDRAYSIMLSAMGDKKVMWQSTTRHLEDVPQQFEWKGKIIVLANKLNLGKGVRRDAIISRALTYELDFTKEEIIEFMREIVNETNHFKLEKEQRNEIIDFIDANTDISNTQLSLRTLERLEELYMYNQRKWKDLAIPLLNKDETTKILMDCLDSCESVTGAQKQFSEMTGHSRATFFRIKSSLKVS